MAQGSHQQGGDRLMSWADEQEFIRWRREGWQSRKGKQHGPKPSIVQGHVLVGNSEKFSEVG